jgi:hypothetical protein
VFVAASFAGATVPISAQAPAKTLPKFEAAMAAQRL